MRPFSARVLAGAPVGIPCARTENWYIGSMLAIAAIEKKRMDER